MALTMTGGPEPLMLAMREHGREKMMNNLILVMVIIMVIGHGVRCIVTKKINLELTIMSCTKVQLCLTDGWTMKRGWETSYGLQMNQVEELFR